MAPQTLARIQIVAAAALFSTGGAAIKIASFDGGFSNWQVASFRALIASIAFLAMVKEARRLPKKLEVLCAIVYAGSMVSFVTANTLTLAANVIFLQSTAPLFVMLLGPWLLKERLRTRDFGFLFAFAVGTAILLSGETHAAGSAPNPKLGNIIALLAGVLWAFSVTGLRFASRQGGTSATVVATGNVLAFVLCLAPALIAKGGGLYPVEHFLSAKAWGALGYLGVFQIGLAYFSLTRGIKHVTALEASLLLMVEPVMNPVWAFIFQGERPGTMIVLGGIFLSAVTIVMAWMESKRPLTAIPKMVEERA